MEIAPGIDSSEWAKLNLDKKDSPDWLKAIDILRGRIEARYLDPIDLLIEVDAKRHAKARRFGFTVMAVDCLLIETLEAFIDGNTITTGDSTAMFQRFLTTRGHFKKYFDLATATRFYHQVRCGILHLGETTGNARIWSVGELLRINGDEMILNRSKFHTELRNEFQEYLGKLAKGTDEIQRRNFRKKMDYICST